MITLDQIKLLEQKVESAVLKIKQLEAESDALRSRCLELTNALSSKTELLTTLQQERDLIESGILSALNNLDKIENDVISSSTESKEESLTVENSTVKEETNISEDNSQVSEIENQTNETTIIEEPTTNEQTDTTTEPIVEDTNQTQNQDFDSLSDVPSTDNIQNNDISEDVQDNEPENNQDELGFDIF